MHQIIINYSFKYNQQDTTLYNILYYCQCSTCFGRFPRPSSGAQELYTQHVTYQACLLLPLAWVSWNCSFELLLLLRASLMYSFKYTNKMQRYTVFFITAQTLHVSSDFSAHHQELKIAVPTHPYNRCCVYSS